MAGPVSVVFLRHVADFRRRLEIGASEASESAAILARRMMVERTARGIDREGRRFKRYAKATRRRRAAAGKIVSRVNLRYTGAMLDALSVRRVRGGNGQMRGEVYFNNSTARRIARYHIFGTHRMPSRDFFGLARPERQLVNVEFGRTVRGSVGGRSGVRRTSLRIMLIQVNRAQN